MQRIREVRLTIPIMIGNFWNKMKEFYEKFKEQPLAIKIILVFLGRSLVR